MLPLRTTGDLLITNQLLYRLSYISVLTGAPPTIRNGVYFTTLFSPRQLEIPRPRPAAFGAGRESRSLYAPEGEYYVLYSA